jgi:hypothetical protein
MSQSRLCTQSVWHGRHQLVCTECWFNRLPRLQQNIRRDQRPPPVPRTNDYVQYLEARHLQVRLRFHRVRIKNLQYSHRQITSKLGQNFHLKQPGWGRNPFPTIRRWCGNTILLLWDLRTWAELRGPVPRILQDCWVHSFQELQLEHSPAQNLRRIHLVFGHRRSQRNIAARGLNYDELFFEGCLVSLCLAQSILQT